MGKGINCSILQPLQALCQCGGRPRAVQTNLQSLYGNSYQRHNRKGNHETDELNEGYPVSLFILTSSPGAPAGGDKKKKEQPFSREEPGNSYDDGHPEPLVTRECSKASAPIELPNGKEVEQVDPRTDTGNGGPDGSAADQKDEISPDRSSQTPERACQPHACILTGVNGVLIESNEGAQTGNEHRG